MITTKKRLPSQKDRSFLPIFEDRSPTLDKSIDSGGETKKSSKEIESIKRRTEPK